MNGGVGQNAYPDDMRLKQQTRILRGKALASLRTAVGAFNSPDEEGRTTRVLLHLQHSFEMLMKAVLVENGVDVFDKKLGRSIGYEACVRAIQRSPAVKISDADAGLLRAVDAMRDDEQHWINDVSEQVLYLHARAGVTLFDDMLWGAFTERLASSLPERVLPISTAPPQALDVILDEEFTQIQSMLAPNKRSRSAARARIRTLLAMEAHVAPDTRVSRKDVNRVEKGIRSGRTRSQVFPKLSEIETQIDGSGVLVTVHFTKKTGMPVTFSTDDEDAAAVREVDLQRKFHRSATELASALDLTTARCLALRRHLGIDANPDCAHRFDFGASRFIRYSDNAYRRMSEAMVLVDMDQVWKAHRPGRAGVSPCPYAGCNDV